jgi:hypothetical protein
MGSLVQFSMADSIALGNALRGEGAGARSGEEVASRMIRRLRSTFVEPDGASSCALARVYVTLSASELPARLRGIAGGILGRELDGATRCLVLLGTEGVEGAWCDRRTSQGHQAIPLPDPSFIEQLPMVTELFRQLGVKADELATGAWGAQGLDQLSVFLVEEAGKSPHIPAQEFVRTHGIRSVLGFGAPLPGGNLMATLLFNRVAVSREVASLFQPLSLNAKFAMLPFARGPFFSDEAA